MVKFAKGEQKPFNPIEKNTISSLAAPPLPVSPPAPPEADPAPVVEAETAPDTTAEREAETTKRPRRPDAKRSALEKLTKQPERGERLTRAVKCLFTPTEYLELREMVGRLAKESGTSLTLSHLFRPYFDLLLHCEEQLAQELGRTTVVRPINDKTAIAVFERRLAEIIHAALRKTPPLRAEPSETER